MNSIFEENLAIIKSQPITQETPVINRNKFLDENKKVSLRLLLDYFQVNHSFISTGSPQRFTIWHYKKDRGFYVADGEEVICQLLQELLDTLCNKSLCSEVVGHVYRRTRVDELPEVKPELLCVQNGVLNVLTRELLPHSSEDVHVQQVPVIYDSEARCVVIEKFLEEVCPEGHNTLKKWVGFCLLKKYKYHNVLMLYGPTHSGKSTFLSLVRALLGASNCVSIPMQRLELDRFSIANLRGKLANIFSDLPRQSMSSTSVLKSLSGEDELSFDRKFKDYDKFVNYGKLMYSCNELPAMSEDSSAVWSRMLLLEFPNERKGRDINRDLLAELTSSENLSGFLNLALEGLAELISQNGFVHETEKTRERYVRESDSLGAFVMDCLCVSPESEVSKQDVYSAYGEYCRLQGYSCLDSNPFFKKLPKYVRVVQTRPAGIHSLKGVSIQSKESTDICILRARGNDNSIDMEKRMDCSDGESLLGWLQKNDFVGNRTRAIELFGDEKIKVAKSTGDIYEESPDWFKVL